MKDNDETRRAYTSQFKVGDKINSLIYPNIEIEGKIIKIVQHMAQVETNKGKYYTPLILARKIN